jgi:lysophospholipase L1-like esterase
MSNGKGGMKPGLASDEVHPTAEGYAVMRPIAEAAIR